MWFGLGKRTQKTIRAKLSAVGRVTDISPSIPLRATRIRVKPQRLTIDTEEHHVPRGSLCLRTHHDRIDIAVGAFPSVTALDTQFTVAIWAVGVLSLEAARPHDFDIQHFHVTASWLSFGSRRPEPRSLFHKCEPRDKGMPVTPVNPLPPPQSIKEGDLSELLRWILTPPINEMISDPQLTLPAQPYPFQ